MDHGKDVCPALFCNGNCGGRTLEVINMDSHIPMASARHDWGMYRILRSRFDRFRGMGFEALGRWRSPISDVQFGQFAVPLTFIVQYRTVRVMDHIRRLQNERKAARDGLRRERGVASSGALAQRASGAAAEYRRQIAAWTTEAME